eukprot:1010340_1
MVVCLGDYSEECTLAPYDRQCTDPSSICNDYVLHTAFPTASPTYAPYNPTFYPSNRKSATYTDYSSFSPTFYPTKPRSAAVAETISSTTKHVDDDENIQENKPKTMFEFSLIFYVIVAVSSTCCVVCVCFLLYQIQLSKNT